MIFRVLNLVVLLCLSIVSFLKSTLLRLLFSTVSSLFIVLQITSIYISESFIDYKFYFNLRDLSVTNGLFLYQPIPMDHFPWKNKTSELN